MPGGLQRVVGRALAVGGGDGALAIEVELGARRCGPGFDGLAEIDEGLAGVRSPVDGEAGAVGGGGAVERGLGPCGGDGGVDVIGACGALVDAGGVSESESVVASRVECVHVAVGVDGDSRGRQGGDGADVAAAQALGVVFEDADALTDVQRDRFGGFRNSPEQLRGRACAVRVGEGGPQYRETVRWSEGAGSREVGLDGGVEALGRSRRSR